MESFVFLAAQLFAVFDALAFANNSEHLPLVAKLALANLDTTLVLIRVGKLGSSNLNDHDLIAEIELSDCQLAAHIGLHRVSGELDARVLLI